ncbi:hypothetical protein MATL_G00066530 [Megalops atlanticus]|uniref:Centrosomal protein POC5 n=1 Tax=Megalops atlanticus TaxID=7932 RepID=A0A9D3QDM2_MEGAT|nr:hypothetical protein MATL_G00066530 [Megalops atlanticus]
MLRCPQTKERQAAQFCQRTLIGAVPSPLSYRMNMRSCCAGDAVSENSGESASEQKCTSSELESARVSPLPIAPRTAGASVEEKLSKTPVDDVEWDGEQSEQSSQGSVDPQVTVTTELFVTEENLGRMEKILDTWSNNLKTNVMTELRKWKLSFKEKHKLELRKEKERHAAHVAGLTAEMDNLKELLDTYKTSNQRKDEVISSLTSRLERQRDRMEMMRTFTHWRLQRTDAKEEAYGSRLAGQHYQLQLKRKVWAAWHSLIETKWRERVERACQARAEQVCVRLSTDYDAKLNEQSEALERARAEVQRLQSEREQYEEAMKKAFMRGVCALNMEAMSMFHVGDNRRERDLPTPRDEPSSSSSVRFLPPPQPASSTRFSPVPSESPPPPPPAHSDSEEMFMSQMGSAPGPSRTGLPSTTVIDSVVPPGGTASSLRQASAHMVTSGQQKAAKTITARITGRSEPGAKATRAPSHLQVTGVAPPMSSVIVERHHPITQLTVGQATAAKFPRPSQQSAVASSGRGLSQKPRGPSSSHIHSIRVVQ